jgi:hypothetical protein
MKRQVLTYTKPAQELTKGDRILTNRQVIETVSKITVAGAVHIVTVGEPQGMKTGHCYLQDEQVLVVE